MVKKGFSLTEALVVMAIISILFSVAAKVITTRPKPPKQNTAHGYFECYIQDGALWQRTVIDRVATEPRAMGEQCQFKPPTGVAFYNINSHDPDITRFEPNINKTLDISILEESFIFNGETLSSDAGSDADNTDNTFFFQTMYPNSEIYNGGTMRKGVMISW